MTPAIGQQAPDFELTDQHGQQVRLSHFQGKQSVVLVFYPFAFSGICTGELCEIRDNLDVFSTDDVQVIGISCDPKYTLRAFAEAEGYDFPLLADFWPHGEVASRYGVFDDTAGMAIRGSFLIDQAGVLRWSVVNGPGEARPLTAYREALAAL
jgi:mycoredoxin-dependent peroxiredoxin